MSLADARQGLPCASRSEPGSPGWVRPGHSRRKKVIVGEQAKNCKTCELVARREAGAAPPWDSIYRTRFWEVAHSYNTALPGWLVLVARRHIEAIDELTDEEALELGLLLQRVSQALKETTGCLKTYVVQFAEMAEHPHVHFHVIPRMKDQPVDRRGTEVFKYLNVPEEQRVGEETMNELAARVRKELFSSSLRSGEISTGE